MNQTNEQLRSPRRVIRCRVTVILLCILATPVVAPAQSELPLRFAWFLDFSPDGKSLVAPYGGWLQNEPGEVRVWDVASGRAKLVLTSPRGVRSAAWSAKGNYFAAGNYGGEVLLYHSQSGAMKLQVSTGNTAEFVQITPDERYLIAAAGNGQVWVWEIATGELMHRMAVHTDSIWGMRIAADSKTLATASKDGTVGVSNIETGEQLFKFEHSRVTIGVAFTADARQLVTGCHDAQIRVWDLGSGQLVRTIRGHRSSVNDLDFSPGDKLLASSSSDRTVRLWDFESGESLATLEGHEQTVYGVRFSPDGKLLASGSWDATIKLWDVEKREQRVTLPLKLEPLADASALRLAARRSFAEGDFDEGHQQLTELLDAWRLQPGGTADDWSQLLGEIAHEYIRVGELDQAMKLLGEAADLNLPFQAASDQGLAAALAGLHRRLADLNAEERYELLHAWSMPTESRRSVRMLTSRTPTDAPPSAFARALGERPRRDSFPIADVGGVRGLFSTAWELVTAAEESGHLRQLSNEAARLTEDSVGGAKLLFALTKIVGANQPSDDVLDELQPYASKTSASAGPPGVRGAMLVAAACMTKEWLWPISRDIIGPIAEAHSGRAPPELFLLRQAYAETVLHRRELAEQTHSLAADLSNWLPAGPAHAAGRAPTASRDVWLSHEDSMIRLAGRRDASLLFRYPVVGDFTFSCEALGGGNDEPAAGIGYNGLTFAASGPAQTFKVWGVGRRSKTRLPMPFVADVKQRLAQRLVLKSATDGPTTMSVNGHEVWRDDQSAAASPWINLWSSNGQTPVFRNLRISGTPTIPREVRLSGDELRSWYSADNIGKPRRGPAEINWYGQDGVIRHGRSEPAEATAASSRLSYIRPLQDSESISYEFAHEAESNSVHPALGRLAFLIEPEGVRIHWMTSGDLEWTGLPDDNSVVEPLNRRGPKPLPLVAGDWNRVTVALADNTLTLTLNDVEVYSRSMEQGASRTFSFYHDRADTPAIVRNVVLRGDWPLTLPRQQLDNLASADTVRPVEDRHTLGAIFNDIHIADSALSVHRRAAQMSVEERYEYLSNWVLPNDDHATLRLEIDFTPTNPPPQAKDIHPVDSDRLERASESGGSRIQLGGHLVSPAIDLIEAAKQLGRLDEVRERIEEASSDSDVQQRNRLALLAVVDLTRENVAAALPSIEELQARDAANKAKAFVPRWPETLAIWQGIRHPESRDVSSYLLYDILQRDVRDPSNGSGLEAWEHQLAALQGRLEHSPSQTEDRHASVPNTSPTSLIDWAPVSRATARSRGQGQPVPHWQPAGGGVEKVAGHSEDYLYYRVPLRGNFEVECDVAAFGWRDTQLSVAGTWVTPDYDMHSYSVGNFRQQLRTDPLDPPMSKVDQWIRYRAVIRDGRYTTWCNGRQLHQQPVDPNHDPWIAVRSLWITAGAVKEVRITGNPLVPDEISLSSSPELTGWHSYYDESIGEPNADWRHDAGDDNIVGRRHPELQGSGLESLLHFHRPMLEDGTIEYDFFYREGQSHTHPALDRLVFLIEPSGVRLHWATDGAFDRTGADPLNVVDEPENRRGPDKLPLQPNAWNHLRLALAGDTVDLILNGTIIYHHELKPTNQRTFGLFHYSDRTEARVRNIVWRGDWPRELPALAQQELARSPTEAIDEGLPRLTARVHHDFAKDGLPMDRFGVHGPDDDWRKDVVVKPDGLHFRRQGIKGYSSYRLAARMRVHGDFDITAKLANLNIQRSEHGSGGLSLTAILENDGYTHGTVYRGALIDPVAPIRQVIQSEFVRSPMGQTRMTWLGTTAEESTAGTMRLARRGETLYCLFAEQDSSQYRLIHTEEVGKESLLWEGVRLTAAVQASGNKPGSTAVIWKDLTVRAERITDWPGTIEQLAPQGNADE